jgi:hypothetical protein
MDEQKTKFEQIAEDVNQEEEPTQEVQDTAETQEPAEKVTEEAAPSTEETEEVKKKSGIEKRFGKLTKKIYELEGKNKVYEQILAQNTQKPKEEPKQEQPVQEPKIDDFETTEEYTKALVDFQTRKVEERVRQQIVEGQQKQKTAQLDQEILTAFDNMTKKGFEEFGEDFYEMTDVPITEDKAVRKDLLNNPHCPKIIKFLHDNPEKAQEAYYMSPYDAGKFFGELTAKLSVKPKTVSQAPTPIKPGGSEPFTTSDYKSGKITSSDVKKEVANYFNRR